MLGTPFQNFSGLSPARSGRYSAAGIKRDWDWPWNWGVNDNRSPFQVSDQYLTNNMNRTGYPTANAGLSTMLGPAAYNSAPYATLPSGVPHDNTSSIRAYEAYSPGISGQANQSTATGGPGILQQLLAMYEPYRQQQHQAAQEQLADLAKAYAIQQSQYGKQQEGNAAEIALRKQLLGVDEQGQNANISSAERQQALLDQLLGYEGNLYSSGQQLFNIQGQFASDQAGVKNRELASDATARGALASGGVRGQFGDIQTSLKSALDTIGQNRSQATTQYQMTQKNYGEKKNALSDDISGFRREIEKIGINKQLLDTQLRDAIDSLGVRRQLDELTYKAQIGTISRGEIEMYHNIVSTAMGQTAMMQDNPSLLPILQKALAGVYGKTTSTPQATSTPTSTRYQRKPV